MGAKKKSKAHILKYVPCILKYLRPIFCPLKTRLKIDRKMRTNCDCATATNPCAAFCVSGLAVARYAFSRAQCYLPGISTQFDEA